MSKQLIKSKLEIEKGIYASVQYEGNDAAKKIVIDQHLVLQAGNEVFEDYCCSNTGLKSITFACDVLEIAAQCKFPAIDVKIFARKLIITDSGSIDVSGKDEDSPLHTNYVYDEVLKQNQGEKAKNGENSGNIDLYCQEITLPQNPKKIFLLNGGKGQAAIPGKDGKDGEDGRIEDRSEPLSNKCSYIVDHPFTGGTPMLGDIGKFSPGDYGRLSEIQEYCINEIKIKHNGLVYNSNWHFDFKKPTNGEDAYVPGQPGHGGNAGQLRTNQSIPDNCIENKPGIAGKKADNTKGGKAGNPQKSAYYEVIVNNPYWGNPYLQKLERGDTKITKPGKDGIAPEAEPGKPQPIINNLPESSWLHPALVENTLAYAKDYFLSGSFESVEDLLQHYDQAMREYSFDNSPDVWRNNHFIPFQAALLELEHLRSKLQNGLDYYGNTGGYLPAISYAAAREFYQRELDSSLFIIMASTELVKSYGNASEKKKLINEFIEHKRKKIGQEKTNHKQAWEVIQELETPIRILADKIEEKLDLLKKVEEKLLDQAKSEETKQRLIKGAFKLGAVACQVIPYGQPALGAFGGTALEQIADTLIPVAQGKAALSWSNLKVFKEAYDQVKDANAKESTILNCTADLEKISGDDTKNEDRKKIEEAIAQAKAGIQKHTVDLRSKGLEKSKDLLTYLKVDEDKVKCYLEELNKWDASLRRTTQEIELLNQEKLELFSKLERARNITKRAEAFITSNLLELAQLHLAKNESVESFNPAVMSILEHAKRNAFDNLYQYFYLLVKAYEGNFLMQFNGNFNLKKFIERLGETIKKTAAEQKEFTSFKKSLDDKKDILKQYLQEQVKLAYENITTSLAQGQRTPWSLSLNDNDEALQTLNLATVGQNKRSTLLFINHFRDEDLLAQHYNARLTAITLTNLSFVLTDNAGNIYPQQDKTKYNFEGTCTILVHARSKGTVRKDTHSVVVLQPEFYLGWNWEYNFKKGDKPKDSGLVLQDNTIQKYLSDHPTFQKEEIIAAPPMETTLQLEFICPPVYRMVEGVKQPVVVKIKELEFDIHFSSSLEPIKTNLKSVRNENKIR